jgi:hypothetical protein
MRQPVIDELTIESTGSFELASKLTVKATLMGRSGPEVSAVWSDRTMRESNDESRAPCPGRLHPHPSRFSGRSVLRQDSCPCDSA